MIIKYYNKTNNYFKSVIVLGVYYEKKLFFHPDYYIYSLYNK